MRVDGGARVLDEVRVRSGRDADVAVAHEPLEAMEVDAATEELGREGVTQVVEARGHLQRLGRERARAAALEG